jgi:cation diffusion facilitator CzcD-associated flavoprotein CzcO
MSLASRLSPACLPQDNTSFQGRQLHAAAFSNPAIVEGKRVVVIGAGRSALESAAMAALPGRAATVTCVFRQVGGSRPL